MKFTKILLIIVIFALIIFINIILLFCFGYDNIYFYFTSKPWTMSATIEKISEYDKNTNLLVKKDSDSSLYYIPIKRYTKLIHNNKKINIADLKIGQKVVITALDDTIIETIPANIDIIKKIEVIDN